jgi:hypothetical protein
MLSKEVGYGRHQRLCLVFPEGIEGYRKRILRIANDKGNKVYGLGHSIHIGLPHGKGSGVKIWQVNEPCQGGISRRIAGYQYR